MKPTWCVGHLSGSQREDWGLCYFIVVFFLVGVMLGFTKILLGIIQKHLYFDYLTQICQEDMMDTSKLT